MLRIHASIVTWKWVMVRQPVLPFREPHLSPCMPCRRCTITCKHIIISMKAGRTGREVSWVTKACRKYLNRVRQAVLPLWGVRGVAQAKA